MLTATITGRTSKNQVNKSWGLITDQMKTAVRLSNKKARKYWFSERLAMLPYPRF